MLDAAREALSFIEGRTRDDLAQDRMLLRSLEREVAIIGEAATRVSEDFRSRHPEVPWADAAGMRNRLIHAYFDINPGILWATVEADLPPW